MLSAWYKYVCTNLALAQDHCFGCCELNFWNSPPILGVRTNMSLSKVLGYQLWGLVMKKIDFALIFGVLEM